MRVKLISWKHYNKIQEKNEDEEVNFEFLDLFICPENAVW